MNGGDSRARYSTQQPAVSTNDVEDGGCAQNNETKPRTTRTRDSIIISCLQRALRQAPYRTHQLRTTTFTCRAKARGYTYYRFCTAFKPSRPARTVHVASVVAWPRLPCMYPKSLMPCVRPIALPSTMRNATPCSPMTPWWPGYLRPIRRKPVRR